MQALHKVLGLPPPSGSGMLVNRIGNIRRHLLRAPHAAPLGPIETQDVLELCAAMHVVNALGVNAVHSGAPAGFSGFKVTWLVSAMSLRAYALVLQFISQRV